MKLLLIIGVLCVIGALLPDRDSTYWEKGAKPDLNAKITKITSRKDRSNKHNVKFVTTVTFSDGFIYTTYDTDREDNLFTYSISTNRELIRRNAVDAHKEAILMLDEGYRKRKKEEARREKIKKVTSPLGITYIVLCSMCALLFLWVCIEFF